LTNLGRLENNTVMGRGTKRPVVLVVEDEALLLLEALDIVTDAGFEALPAANADEALRLLESRDDIQVVFTDVNMPGSMDGIKLAHAIRHRWPPVKLIVTSGYFMRSDQHLPSGGRFFKKPYEGPQISNALRELTA
jgi:two-component system, response regulator PdtaR